MSDRTYADVAGQASFEDLTGIRSKTPDEVRGAVNAAVSAAAGLAVDIGRQASVTASKAVGGPEAPQADPVQPEPTLEGNVAAMDAPDYNSGVTHQNDCLSTPERQVETEQDAPDFM